MLKKVKAFKNETTKLENIPNISRFNVPKAAVQGPMRQKKFMVHIL